MNATSLDNKTIRPGSLVGYSYYHSARRPYPVAKAAPKPKLNRGSKLLLRWAMLIIVAIALGLVGMSLLRGNSTPSTVGQRTTPKTPPTTSPKSSAPSAAAVSQTTNHCAGNKLDKLVLVSIAQRHLWACQGSKTLYNSPVITGIEFHDSTLTPPGTYHIYAKQTDQTLTGSDVTGSWSDPVQYWMPFLNNPYGTYGLHDATWRPNNAFGNISPVSSDASHGCVELPLATAKWLYNWVEVGTTVTIND
jgi:lipoprotein-anchoring transpeptidase ErfK/SrfK